MTNLELPSPTEMSAQARASEITGILAGAIVRTHLAGKHNEREVDLGFSLDQRVHTTPSYQEKL
jgi:hypothetical protein